MIGEEDLVINVWTIEDVFNDDCLYSEDVEILNYYSISCLLESPRMFYFFL